MPTAAIVPKEIDLPSLISHPKLCTELLMNSKKWKFLPVKKVSGNDSLSLVSRRTEYNLKEVIKWLVLAVENQSLDVSVIR